MSPLRQRMLEDMELGGLAPRTRETYVQAVYALAAYYRRSPDELSEEDVRAYLLDLKARGVARGTFKTSHYGIRFLYCQTLNRDWPLFGKKRSVSPSPSVCPMPLPTRMSAFS
ncbi:MAG: phage integrase N-terminal SAM-like domain-containing protein [Magnetococcales bacterium]|nr:phage integrase N-terminal SAM-like domain-containing protein [Magnetococcales bacterium]